MRTDAALDVVVKTEVGVARFQEIHRLAQAFHTVRYQSGEIIEGGNTFVTVEIDRALTQPIVDRIRPQLDTLACNRWLVLGEYEINRRDRTFFVRLNCSLDTERPPASSSTVLGFHSHGTSRTARRIAEHALQHHTTIEPATSRVSVVEPPPKRGGTITPAFSVVDCDAAEEVAHTCSRFGPGDLISAYTRDDGISDGVFVDLRDPKSFSRAFPGVDHAGSLELVNRTFGRDKSAVPVALSASVAAVIDLAINHPTHGNDIVGVLHDLFWMAFLGRFITYVRAAVAKDGLERQFAVIVTGAGRVRNHRWIAVLDGDGVTFMAPEDR